MVVLRPEPVILSDERSKALLFNLIASYPIGATFELADCMYQWFGSDERVLAAFLEWLDGRGLEIRKKQ